MLWNHTTMHGRYKCILLHFKNPFSIVFLQWREISIHSIFNSYILPLFQITCQLLNLFGSKFDDMFLSPNQELFLKIQPYGWEKHGQLGEVLKFSSS